MKKIVKMAVLDMSKLFLSFLLDFLLLRFAPDDFLGMTSRKPSVAGAVALALLSAPGYCLSCPICCSHVSLIL